MYVTYVYVICTFIYVHGKIHEGIIELNSLTLFKLLLT